MGNVGSWISQSLCPEEQQIWQCAYQGKKDVLSELLGRLTRDKRHYIEWKDQSGQSPLLVAASNGHAHCVSLLLSAGADCNSVDSQLNTPLHAACRNGHAETARVLLDAPGIQPFRLNTSRMTALDVVRFELKQAQEDGYKYDHCVQVLESKFCLFIGWLYESVDNILSMASGLSSLNSWRKRYCMVLRTGAYDILQLEFFAMKPGDRKPLLPCSEFLYRVTDGMQTTVDNKWFNRKHYTFSLKAFPKMSNSIMGVPLDVDFAAGSQKEFNAWKMFLLTQAAAGPHPPSVQALPMSYSTSVYSTATVAARNSPSCSVTSSIHSEPRTAATTDATNTSVVRDSPSDFVFSSEQERMDYERAIAESLQQTNRTQSGASAPEWSDALVSVGVDVSVRNESGTLAASMNECVVCFDGPQAAVCVPCGHNAVCMECATQILDTSKTCPVCRLTVREIIKLYRV